MPYWRKITSASAKWGDAGRGRFERRARKQLKASDRKERDIGYFSDGGR